MQNNTILWETFLWPGKKGLYCRIPTGQPGSGKLFFPDRSCKNLTSGPIQITQLHDHGSYGFFVGRMKIYQTPNEKALADYILQKGYQNAKIFFKNGANGSYVVMKGSGMMYQEILAADSEGNVAIVYDMGPFIERDTTVEEISAMDFLCQGFQGCDVNDLLLEFQPCSYFLPGNLPRSSKENASEFYRACQNGFLSIFRVCNCDVAVVNPDQILWAICNMDQEEMDDLITAVNEMNEMANELLFKKIKSGKISLST